MAPQNDEKNLKFNFIAKYQKMKYSTNIDESKIVYFYLTPFL